MTQLVYLPLANFAKRGPKPTDSSFDESQYAGRSNIFGDDPYLAEVKRRMNSDIHEEDRF